MSYYETQRLLNEYLLFHYGNGADQLPWSFGPANALGFPQRCVHETLDRSILSSGARALDVGCAVGRSSFELSRFCDEVIGIDYSRSFIDAAQQMAETGGMEYTILETGKIERLVRAELPPDTRPERVRFEWGDAMALRADLGKFDVVLACNLLCRLSAPGLFLERLAGLVKSGGQLVITTPHTWLEEFTAAEYWLGATPETGEPLEAITALLDAEFDLRQRLDLPFLIREHRRKYQWSVAEATVWLKR